MDGCHNCGFRIAGAGTDRALSHDSLYLKIQQKSLRSLCVKASEFSILSIVRLGVLFLVVVMLPLGVCAEDCWKDVQPGRHDQELRCLFLDWKAQPDSENLKQVLDSLFYVYLSSSADPEMKSFFDGMRRSDPKYIPVLQFRADLIAKYTFDDVADGERSSVWAMAPADAKRLFVLSQTHPGSVPREIAVPMQLSVFDEIDRYFDFNSAFKQPLGSLSVEEYARLLEVLQRMAALQDPFVYAVNQYHQGIVRTNLGDFLASRENFSRSEFALHSLITSAADPLSRKRFLLMQAHVCIVQDKDLLAEESYYDILRIDPEDWTSLLELSYVLNKRGECSEPSLWVEATLPHNEKLFEVVVHCGTHTLPEPLYPTEPPAIALLHAGHTIRM